MRCNPYRNPRAFSTTSNAAESVPTASTVASSRFAGRGWITSRSGCFALPKRASRPPTSGHLLGGAPRRLGRAAREVTAVLNVRSASLAHVAALPGHLAGSVAPDRTPGKRVLNVRSASLAHAAVRPGHLAGSVAPDRTPGKRVLKVRSASLAHASASGRNPRSRRLL